MSEEKSRVLKWIKKKTLDPFRTMSLYTRFLLPRPAVNYYYQWCTPLKKLVLFVIIYPFMNFIPIEKLLVF